jgi:hypothetical protein
MYFESQYLVKHTKNVDKNLLQAEQLSFPLDAYKPDEISTTTMATTFKVKILKFSMQMSGFRSSY